MKKLVLVGTALAALLATPAFAQDVNPAFTGPRIELLVGYDNLGGSLDLDDEDGEGGRESIGNIMYGGGAGFDFAFGGVLAGVEGEYSNYLRTEEFGQDGVRGEFDDFELTNGSLRPDRDIYVGGRVGVIVGTKTLIYAKGGYINSRLKLRVDGNDGTDDFNFRQNLKFDGFRVGGGAEFAFPDGFFGKAEYRYSSYSGGEINADGEDLDIGEAFDSIDLDRHQLVFGLGYRF